MEIIKIRRKKRRNFYGINTCIQRLCVLYICMSCVGIILQKNAEEMKGVYESNRMRAVYTCVLYTCIHHYGTITWIQGKGGGRSAVQ